MAKCPYGLTVLAAPWEHFAHPWRQGLREHLKLGCGNAGRDAWRGGGEPGSPPPFSGNRLGPAAGSLDRAFFPDAVLARFRHREDGDEEHDRRNDDGVREGPAQAPRAEVGRRGHDRDQTATPAVADVVRHGDRGVADAAWDELREERTDRAVGHPHVVHQDHDDQDGHPVVDVLRVRVVSERGVERVVRQRGQRHAAQDDRLAADLVGEPAPEDQGRGGDQERDPDDRARGQHVQLLDRLEEVERPELPAVPDAPLPQDDHAGDDHVLDVAAHERFAPRVGRGATPGLDLLEDRRLAEREPDVDRDRDEQERDDERQAPTPGVEGFDAEPGSDADDRGQRNDDAEGGRRLQPSRVVPTVLVIDVLGHVRDRAAVLATQAEALDQTEDEQDDRGGQPDHLIGRHEADERSREPHAAQRDEKGVLAADLVTEPAEEERPQRPDQEADRENRYRAQEGRDGVTLLEELDGENRRQTAEDIEVVPLDDVSNSRRDDDAAELPG